MRSLNIEIHSRLKICRFWKIWMFICQLYLTVKSYVMLCYLVCQRLCAIWYHLYNLKNVKNTHGGVLLLVNVWAKSFNFNNTPPCVFLTFFILYKWYQITENLPYSLVIQVEAWDHLGHCSTFLRHFAFS